jgi:WD40 repeat protein
VAVIPVDQFLAFTTITQDVRVRSVSTNEQVLALRHPAVYQTRAVAFSADGRRLAVAAADAVRRWDLAAAREKQVLAGHASGVPCVAFSPDGRRLASGSKDGTVRLWDLATGQAAHSLAGFRGFVQTLAFRPDGGLLAVGDWSGELRFFDPTTGRLLATRAIAPQVGAVNGVAFSPDGERLFACGDSGFGVWRVARGAAPDLELLSRVPGGRVAYLCVSPDGQWVAWADQMTRARLWDVAAGREVPFPGPPLRRGWHGLAFHGDGKHLLYVTAAGSTEAWDVTTGKRTFTLGRPGEFEGLGLAASPDGHWLATDPAPSAVTLWALDSGQRFDLPRERSAVWSLAWSRDHGRLAVGLADGGLVVWDLPEVRAQLARIGLGW